MLIVILSKDLKNEKSCFVYLILYRYMRGIYILYGIFLSCMNTFDAIFKKKKKARISQNSWLG